MSIPEIEGYKHDRCACGKTHHFSSEVLIGNGILQELPALLERLSAQKIYLVADQNTDAVAGKAVCDLLKKANKTVLKYTFSDEKVIPDERSVGLAVMHYEADCDLILGVGSGVINDICKIVATVSKKPYVIVATAPSMDGYASASSSMERNGLKISLNSKAPDVILGDLDILSTAPLKMMVAGLGDMLAKYISICDWRIAHLITSEYYCEEVAALVRAALKKCIDHAEGLLNRDQNAIKAVFEGLIICGAAMEYAGVSRPASGVEHYISHVLDMRGVAFETPVDLHGIQCAIGTLYALRLYEKLKTIVPDKEKALASVEAFDYKAWSKHLRDFLGQGAESMIALEEKEQKYSKEKHAERLEIILQNWDRILDIIEQELPPYQELDQLWNTLSAPRTLKELGIDNTLFRPIFESTKDIRDKYVLSRLVWDLGITEELLEDF